jgi:ribonuclease J
MPHSDDLVYLALGGAGEIGMNMYLYGHGRGDKRRWIMVDCGVGFGDMETSPGIDLVMADPRFIEQQADKLDAIFITHAHEDHIGALGHLLPRLQAPIYARKFTGLHVKRKLEEQGRRVSAVKIVGDKPVKAGPFTVRFLPVTHSIPEASALVIDTPSGRIVHSGDFKIDANPQIGEGFDAALFEAIGEEGVDVLACDSTNVFLDGFGGSEADVIDALAKIIRNAKGAVAATTFASNLARVRSLAVIAKKEGRSIVLAGRAMRRMIEAAVETGIITDFPEVTPEDQAAHIPADHLFYLVTGSQGEGRAALARIATGSHPSVSLGEGDTVIFSSKTIPGNEASVYRVFNQLSEMGVRVIDESHGRIHVSGHARRGDIMTLYKALKPKAVVPIHGEHRHLVEHADFAEEWGAKSAVAPNGAIVALGAGRPRVLEHVETGRLYLDGSVLIGAMDGVVRSRLKLARQGHVVVSITVDEDGALLADPLAIVTGGPEMAEGFTAPLVEMIEEAVDAAIESAPRKRRSDKALEEIAAQTTRRVCQRFWGKKPIVDVLLTRLED